VTRRGVSFQNGVLGRAQINLENVLRNLSTEPVVIPAYDPWPSLVEVVRALAEKGVPAIVLIDDGSGPAYHDRFEQAASYPHVYLLRHDHNRGKGAALKTGIGFAVEHFPHLTGS
jgi:hypothetical protein